MARLRENPRFCNNEVVGAQKKAENFWYYYKWWVLGGVLVVTFAVFMINDLLTKEKYDSSVVLVTHEALTAEQVDSIDSILDELASDRDGDGTANVSTIYISGYGQEDNAYSYASDMQFTVYLQADENNIWIIDTFTKEHLDSAGVLGDVFIGDAISLDTLFSETPGLEDVSGYWLMTRPKLNICDQALYDSDMALAGALTEFSK